MITCKVDMTRFGIVWKALKEVVPQDAVEFVKDETARLAEECAQQLSLRGSKDRGGLNRDIRSVFAPLPKNAFTDPSKINGDGMKWIAAGPNYLTGVKPLRYHVEDSVEDMERLFYRSKGLLPADRTSEIGIHGHSHLWNFRKRQAYGRQHVYELQRLVVKRKTYDAFKKKLKLRFGRLEASFAVTAKILRGGTAKVKAYIARHLAGSESLPNITELEGLSKVGAPSITFGSFAPGVTGFEGHIDDAVAVRTTKMEMRYELILSGYAKEASATIAPTRSARRVAVID